MHILLIVLLLLGGFGVSNIRDKKFKLKLVVVWSGFVLFLYGALRSINVGTDVNGYSLSYLQLQNISFKEIFLSNTVISRDPFFYYLLKILTYINTDPQFMIVVTTAIVIICLSVFIYKNSVNPLLSFVLFVGLRFYSFTLSGLRQAVAWSIIMLSYNFIKEKKPIKFLILVLIASLFHKSALIFLIAYPFAKIKRIGSISFAVPFIFIFNYVTNNSLVEIALKLSFFQQYDGQLSNGNNNSGSTLLLIYIGIYIFSLILRKKTNDESQENYQMYNLTLLGIIITMLSLDYDNFFRIGYYFIFSIVLLLPHTINRIGDEKTRNLVSAIVIILIIAQFIIIGPGAGTENYSFFWG
ncbi:EpsG family protein [Paenibacillus sp. 22594]|uniref:EpsG family protein n=1 Tax=Paenibacillus sp. 22594 TaxID=3453947 RepID=UPI003F82C574